MPRRVPARGRGRETELCIILCEGERERRIGSLANSVIPASADNWQALVAPDFVDRLQHTLLEGGVLDFEFLNQT